MKCMFAPHVALQRSQAVKELELKKPVFRIIPDKFVLEPYEACVITLEGSSNEYEHLHIQIKHVHVHVHVHACIVAVCMSCIYCVLAVMCN